jgi:glycosyltransferase involved in cell wall biosynthesis
MKLLVISYFCPTLDRAGGVQQVVAPLLEALTNSEGLTVQVAHPGGCRHPGHHALTSILVPDEVDQVDPTALVSWKDELSLLERGADLVMSVDRALPLPASTPRVLMCNTLAYVNEAHAVFAQRWSKIVTPTEHLAVQVRGLTDVQVQVVPYGITSPVLKCLSDLRDPDWDTEPWIVWLPHRPDARKGHAAAIRALECGHLDRELRLRISWLNEPRYVRFRNELQQLADTVGVGARIEFIAWERDEDRFKCLAQANAVVQIGHFEESFGLSIIEATLGGRVAITGPQPAVAEVLGRTVLHQEVDRPTDWPARLASAVEHLRTIPSAARRPRLLLSIDEMARRYAKMFYGVVRSQAIWGD